MELIVYTTSSFLVLMSLLIFQKWRDFWKGGGKAFDNYVYCDNFTEIGSIKYSVLSVKASFYLFIGFRKSYLVVWLSEWWASLSQK